MFDTYIRNLKFDGCIFNASGPRCTTIEELKKLDTSDSCCVLSKSCTLNVRSGNPKPRYFDHNLGSINSMGLPNLSCQYYINCSHQIEKPYFISIGVLSLNELTQILTQILANISKSNSVNKNNIKGVEINLSCPNIVGKGQLAYNFKDVDTYLKTIFSIIDSSSLLIGIKLPPYFELHHFSEMSDILSKYRIDFITCINSIGNGLIIDVDKECTVIKPKNGVGGIGGRYVKPTGLSNVYNFFREFQKRKIETKIIGCGGIENGTDAFEYLLCGANMVQIGTQFQKEDINCFERIKKELKLLMEKKGYNHINDVIGKLMMV